MIRTIAKPYLLFLGDADSGYGAKTAEGLAHWRPDDCVGQTKLPGCEVDLGIPELSIEEAAERGAKTLVLGVAARGGILPPSWVTSVVCALRAGLDVASGLHDRLSSFPDIVAAAQECDRTLHDVRHPPQKLPLATGEPRSGRRVLMIGTDCAVGKKFTALAIHREMVARGIDASFRPTGQTGVLIAGEGIALDAVPGDFISGVAEALSPAAPDTHWDVVEGQATVLHPTFAAVTTGLVHGTQPEALVLCHQAGRRTVRGLDHRPLPSIQESIDAHLACARVTSPHVRAAAISIDTHLLSESDAYGALHIANQKTGLPATDPVRFGAGVLVDALLAE
ncbi:MAG: DUF1611 domain-containing protein [Pseudomonadota bacterium]